MRDLPGMTRIACPAACTADKCVITEVGCCAHPCMSGLQEGVPNPKSLMRFGEACKFLGVINKGEVA